MSDDNEYNGNDRRKDISNKELLDLIREERQASSDAIMANIATLNDKLELLIQVSISEANEAVTDHIKNSLPPDHDEDHRTIKMIRNAFSSFVSGLFGTLGKFALVIILLGIGLQLTSFGEMVKQNTHSVDSHIDNR